MSINRVTGFSVSCTDDHAVTGVPPNHEVTKRTKEHEELQTLHLTAETRRTLRRLLEKGKGEKPLGGENAKNAEAGGKRERDSENKAEETAGSTDGAEPTPPRLRRPGPTPPGATKGE